MHTHNQNIVNDFTQTTKPSQTLFKNQKALTKLISSQCIVRTMGEGVTQTFARGTKF